MVCFNFALLKIRIRENLAASGRTGVVCCLEQFLTSYKINNKVSWIRTEVAMKRATSLSLMLVKPAGLQPKGTCGGGWRCPRPIEKYSLTSLEQRLVKTGGGWSSLPDITGVASGVASELAAVLGDVGRIASCRPDGIR